MKKLKTVILLLILTLNLTISTSSSNGISSYSAAPSIGLTDEVTGQ